MNANSVPPWHRAPFYRVAENIPSPKAGLSTAGKETSRGKSSVLNAIEVECKEIISLHEDYESSGNDVSSKYDEPFQLVSYVPSGDNEVTQWLQKINLEKYAPSFAADGYDELWIIARMTVDDAKDLGVSEEDINDVLMPAVADLRARFGTEDVDAEQSYAQVIQRLKEKISTLEKSKSEALQTAHNAVENLKSAKIDHENRLETMIEEHTRVERDLSEAKKRIVELEDETKRREEEIKSLKEDVSRLKRDVKDREDEHLALRRSSAEAVVASQRAASEKLMEIRKEHLQKVLDLKREYADRIEDESAKAREKIAKAYHVSQDKLTATQQSCNRFCAEAQQRAFKHIADEEIKWKDRLQEERSKTAKAVADVSAQSEKRIAAIQDRASRAVSNAQVELSKMQRQILEARSRSGQLEWLLEKERGARGAGERALAALRAEHSMKCEGLVERVATLEQLLFDTKDELAKTRREEKNGVVEINRLRESLKASEKRVRDMQASMSEATEKANNAIQRERIRKVQDDVIAEIRSNLESDLKTAAAGGAALAALQRDVTEAVHKAEMAAIEAKRVVETLRLAEKETETKIKAYADDARVAAEDSKRAARKVEEEELRVETSLARAVMETARASHNAVEASLTAQREAPSGA
eukprot:g3056.t1